MPHSSGCVACTGEHIFGTIDGLDGGAIVDLEAFSVEDGNITRVCELPDRKKGAVVELGDDVGTSGFQAEHGKIKFGLMCRCHEATVGVLDMYWVGCGSFIDDRAVEAGIVGCTSRVGCDDGGGTRQ